MIEPLGGVGLDVKASWELAHDGDLAAKHTYCKAINHSKVFFIFFSINNLFYTFFGYINPNHSKVFYLFFSYFIASVLMCDVRYMVYGILLYLAAINIVAFFLYGIDKRKAQHDKWRVTEARLIAVALLGGSVGALLGMKIWHHKTLHNKFRFGLPLILCLHLAIALAAVYFYHYFFAR